MSYTPNVPQANQTIASTTTPIRNNFTFINADLQVEHTFNGNTAAAEGTHTKCSMPGIATPSLPAGCDGSYYVSNTTSNAKYVTASNNYTLSIYTSLLRGNVSINLAGTNLPVDANTAGTVWLYNASIPFTTTISYYNTGGVTYANTSVVDQGGSDVTRLSAANSNAGNFIRITPVNATYATTFKFNILGFVP